MSKHDKAQQEKRKRNEAYVRVYGQLVCKDCGHRSSVRYPWPCKMCGSKKRKRRRT